MHQPDDLSTPPARLKFEGHGYGYDPDKRHAWRGVEVVRADAYAVALVDARTLAAFARFLLGDVQPPKSVRDALARYPEDATR